MAKVMSENISNIKEVQNLLNCFLKANMIQCESVKTNSCSNSLIAQFEDSKAAFSYLKYMNLNKNRPDLRDLKNRLIVSKTQSNNFNAKSIRSNIISQYSSSLKPLEVHFNEFSSNEASLPSNQPNINEPYLVRSKYLNHTNKTENNSQASQTKFKEIKQKPDVSTLRGKIKGNELMLPSKY